MEGTERDAFGSHTQAIQSQYLARLTSFLVVTSNVQYVRYTGCYRI